MKHLIACALVSLTVGCSHNLQRDYVDAMEATRLAIEADVQAGLYKPDARSKATLSKWQKANKDADAALKKEGK